MTWQAVARKDFQDAVRSYWLWGLSAIFAGVLTFPPALIVFDVIQLSQQAQQGISTDLFINLMRDTMTVLVPIIAIVLAYASIAGERDSGTLKLLLSLPHSRLDIVFGKVVGRGAVIALSVFIGFAVAGTVFLATAVSFKSQTYFLFTLLTIFLGVVFVAIAVGVSAAARSTRRAMIGTVGIYVLFTLLWSQSINGLLRLLTDHTGLESGSESVVHARVVLKLLNPTQAYKSLAAVLTLPEEVQISPFMPNVTVSKTAAARLQITGGQGVQVFIDGSVPFYLSDPFVVLLMGLWLIGAPLIGYLIFREDDLT